MKNGTYPLAECNWKSSPRKRKYGDRHRICAWEEGGGPKGGTDIEKECLVMDDYRISITRIEDSRRYMAKEFGGLYLWNRGI